MNKVINHGSIPVCVKTDAVIFAVNPKKAPIDISNEFWDEAKTVSKLKYDEKVELLERSILTNTEASVFELKPKDYKEYDEANIYADNNYDNIVNTVIQSKEGCLVNGLAGTGKTFLLNNMVKQINATLATKTVVVKQGKKQVKKTVVLEQIRRLAPTNVSALLIDGETLDKFTHSISNGKLNKFKNIKYIFVDEISMVREQFIKTLLLIKHGFPNIKFIISGDFNQLEPVLDRDKVLSNANRVNKYFDYKNSRALFELVDGNKLELTRCKRSDNFLFEICKDVIKSIPIDISQFNRPIETYLNICHTNDTRKKVNNKCMERFINETNPTTTVSFKKLDFDDSSQAYTLCSGMPIISRLNRKDLNVFNNEMFHTVSIGREFITISNEMKQNIQVPVNKFNRIFQPAFCITTHRSQGATFNQPYTIYEYRQMTSKLKYVALSRSSSEFNIIIK